MSAASPSPSPVRLGLSEVHALALNALVANGFSADNAQAVAGCVTEAERDKAHSHGLARIPGYVRLATSGRIRGHARPQVLSGNAPGQLVVDGDGGFSAPAVAAARAAMLERLARDGFVLASFRKCHHLHALWWDVEPLAEKGALAFAVVASRPVMAVFGGTKRALGTNPIAVSCPVSDGPPLTIDMATAAIARGDISIAAAAGRLIPAETALDEAGIPTTDPATALRGSQLPFASSPKASALALMVELLAVGLSGGQFGFEAQAKADYADGPLDTGSVILAVDPQRLGSLSFAARTSDLIKHLSSAGAERLPGLRRHAARQVSLSGGVEVPRRLHDEISKLAEV